MIGLQSIYRPMPLEASLIHRFGELPQMTRKEDKMSGKKGILSLAFVGVLVVLAGVILVMNANAQKGKGWPALNAKARFISGDTIIPGILNKIVNDDPAAYYENVGNNTISIGNPHWIVSIYTDRQSSRYVNLYFDNVVSGPGQDLPSFCAKPYFIYPQIIVPITTTHLYMKGTGELELIPDPNDPDYPTIQTKNSTLNFDNMTEGQETITYATWFYFHVPDLKSTKGTDESRVINSFMGCQWVKVTAHDYYGGKAHRYVFKPITEPFKRRPWDWDPEDPLQIDRWIYHPEGTIPHELFSSSSTQCDHGTYRMPWELEIVRIQ